MGSEWHEVSLGDLFSVKHGFAFKGEHFSKTPTNNLLVTPGNFAIGGGFQDEKPKYYSGPIPEDYILAPGDIIVTMTDLSKQSDTLGLSAVVPEDQKTWLHNQRIGLLQFDKDVQIDPTFVNYLLRTHEYRSWIIGSATGTTVKHTSPKRIQAYTCEVPCYKEQKKIGETLSALDRKIALNHQINTTLESMAQALFKSWFVDFDPVIDNALAAGNPIPEALQARADARAALGDQRRPLPDHIRQQFPDRFVLTEDMGWVPEGWHIGTIGEEVETTGGGTPSTKNPDFWDDGIHPFCTPKDMSQLKSLVLMDTERHLTDAGVQKISSGQLPKGTVLMSSRAPIGYLAISDIPVSINQGIIAMLPNQHYGPVYLLCWAKTNMNQITERANGSTFQEISKKNFRPIPFLVPGKGILEAFNEKAEAIYSRILLTSEQTDALTKLRDTLLPKLLSGELRIPKEERPVAEII